MPKQLRNACIHQHIYIVILRMYLINLCNFLQDMVTMPISSHPTLSRAMTGHLMTLHNTIMKEVGKYQESL